MGGNMVISTINPKYHWIQANPSKAMSQNQIKNVYTLATAMNRSTSMILLLAGVNAVYNAKNIIGERYGIILLNRCLIPGQKYPRKNILFPFHLI